MDPLTLFALANGAVSAVKQGCKLYKEIRGAAADVKGVLQDLEEQFNSRHKEKPPTVAEKNQYIQEKNRVIELSKQQPDDIYTQIGEQLGVYFENMSTCMAIFEEEERHSNEVYTGNVSLGKRALQRVLMASKLEAMQAELREIMVYQCPPELGDLYTRVEKMMDRMRREQSIAIMNKMRNDRIDAAKKRIKIEYWKQKGITYFAVTICITFFVWMLWATVEMRKSQYPELGSCFIPKGAPGYAWYNSLRWVNCEVSEDYKIQYFRPYKEQD